MTGSFTPETLSRFWEVGNHDFSHPFWKRFVNGINAYEQTEAMKAALELEIFRRR